MDHTGLGGCPSHCDHWSCSNPHCTHDQDSLGSKFIIMIITNNQNPSRISLSSTCVRIRSLWHRPITKPSRQCNQQEQNRISPLSSDVTRPNSIYPAQHASTSLSPSLSPSLSTQELLSSSAKKAPSSNTIARLKTSESSSQTATLVNRKQAPTCVAFTSVVLQQHLTPCWNLERLFSPTSNSMVILRRSRIVGST